MGDAFCGETFNVCVNQISTLSFLCPTKQFLEVSKLACYSPLVSLKT